MSGDRERLDRLEAQLGCDPRPTPAVYLDEPLFRKLTERSKGLSKDIQIMSPTLVRQFLRFKGLPPSLSDEVVSHMLELLA